MCCASARGRRRRLVEKLVQRFVGDLGAFEAVVVEEDKLQRIANKAIEQVDTQMPALADDDIDLENLDVTGGDEDENKDAVGRDDVKVVGIDAVPEAIAAIQDGTMTATVSSDGPWQGGIGLAMGYCAATGELDAELERMRVFLGL